MPTPKPGTYRKGDDVRLATTAAEAVTLQWSGYVPETAQAVAEAYDRPALQARAKELGIPANQKSSALAEAIAAKEVDGEGVVTGTAGLNAPDLGDGSRVVVGDGDTVVDAGPTPPSV